jgi:hypothetical protein
MEEMSGMVQLSLSGTRYYPSALSSKEILLDQCYHSKVRLKSANGTYLIEIDGKYIASDLAPDV